MALITTGDTAGGSSIPNPITVPVTITPADNTVDALHVDAAPGSAHAVVIKRPSSETGASLELTDEVDSPYGRFSSSGCYFETQRGNEVCYTILGGHHVQGSLNLFPQTANLFEWWPSSDDSNATSLIGPSGAATFDAQALRASFIADPNFDNLIVYVAITAGTGGNAITIEYVNDGASQPLSVSVAGSAITVHLATDGAAAITSTADDVIAAVFADGAASALVAVGRFVGTSGSTVIPAAMAAQNLAGGAIAPSPLTLLNVPTADPHVLGQLWNNAGVLMVSAG